MRGLKQVEKFLCFTEAICLRNMFFNHLNFLPRGSVVRNSSSSSMIVIPQIYFDGTVSFGGTRNARVRTSGENLFVVLLVMAPSSQELEPPANPGRFKGPIR